MATSTARKPHQRYHLANGDRVPGVTTILDTINKPALLAWANKLGRQGIKSTEFLNHVADAGTLAHSLIQSRLTGAEQDTRGYAQDQVKMAENALASFRAWARGKALETRQMELSLVSETHGFGGSFDWYGLLDGVLTLIDFKTSSGIYPDHLYQLAGYHQLLVENGYAVDGARVLQVGRSEGEEYSERALSVPEIEPYWQVFKAALGLYNAIGLATTKRRAW